MVYEVYDSVLRIDIINYGNSSVSDNNVVYSVYTSTRNSVGCGQFYWTYLIRRYCGSAVEDAKPITNWKCIRHISRIYTLLHSPINSIYYV